MCREWTSRSPIRASTASGKVTAPATGALPVREVGRQLQLNGELLASLLGHEFGFSIKNCRVDGGARGV